MSDQPTQSRHPWRATARTVFAAAVAIIPVLPAVAEVLGVHTVPWIAAFLIAIGGVTRVLAMPQVTEWLRRFVLTGWLTPEPNKPKESNGLR